MNIVILGAPASGKGTQAALISRDFSLYHLQTGDIARSMAEKDSRLKEIIDSGRLVPEEEMTLYVMDLLHQKKDDMKDILFEGFPRFISQYEALENFLKNKGDDIDAVFSLDLNQEEAIKRISTRRICKECGAVYNLITKPSKVADKCDVCEGVLYQRKDDQEAAIQTRFVYYQNNTKELIDYLDKKGKLVRIDGSKKIEEVHEILKNLIQAIKDKTASK